MAWESQDDVDANFGFGADKMILLLLLCPVYTGKFFSVFEWLCACVVVLIGDCYCLILNSIQKPRIVCAVEFTSWLKETDKHHTTSYYSVLQTGCDGVGVCNKHPHHHSLLPK